MAMNNSLAEVHPELVFEWSEKNLPLTPDDITFGSNKKVWWKGACGHEWQTSVKARSNGEKCPICSGARVIAGINDLATLEPLLAKQWSKKNKIKPTEVFIGSHKKVIWKCEKGHEWEAAVKSRTINKTGCPYCSGYIFLKGFNDLQTTHPEIASEWSEKNLPLKPDEVNAKSRKNIWWKCRKCGNEWSMKINERTILKKGCRICEQEYLSLFPALAVSYYSNKKGLKSELGSDRLLGVPLETYIPSEKLAIESGSADENIEIMKAYMCKQRGIRLIKLPMKGTELDYANNLKKAFQSVHIFISSDTEEDVEIIKNTFERWRDSQYSLDEITEIFCKLGLRICNSFADFSGKPSSDNDIQLMVYSIRE